MKVDMTRLRSIASGLRKAAPAGIPVGRLDLAPVGPEPSTIHIGLDDGGRLCVAFELDDEDDVPYSMHLGGLELDELRYTTPAGRAARAAVLTSLDTVHDDLMLSVAERVLLGLPEERGVRLSEDIKAILERWAEALRRPREPMSDAVLVGLLGELCVLGWLLDGTALDDPGADALLSSWVGPGGAPRDFEFGPSAIEVKATTSKGSGWAVTINGTEQLEAPEPSGVLGLVVLRFRSGGSMHLPGMLARIEQLGAPRGVLLDRVFELGYITTLRESFERRTFTLVDRRAHEVVDAFPRLTRSSFVSGAPAPAISRLSYRVDLGDAPGLVPDDHVERFVNRIAGGGHEHA